MTRMDELLAELLQAADTGADAPVHLQGTLSVEEAYSLQCMLLDRRMSTGARHIGWKIGQTNTALRDERGETLQAPGFLLAADEIPDGHILDLNGADNWYLEPELAVHLGEDLQGPDVTADAAQAAIVAVAPAYELIRPHPGWPDRWLQRAVNLSSVGIVLGPRQDGCPTRGALDDLEVTLSCNGDTRSTVRGGDANDNPLDSVAWLANFLAGLGRRLHAGHVVLTGTYCGLVPMAPGQRWRSTLTGLGSVELSTR